MRACPVHSHLGGQVGSGKLSWDPPTGMGGAKQPLQEPLCPPPALPQPLGLPVSCGHAQVSDCPLQSCRHAGAAGTACSRLLAQRGACLARAGVSPPHSSGATRPGRAVPCASPGRATKPTAGRDAQDGASPGCAGQTPAQESLLEAKPLLWGVHCPGNPGTPLKPQPTHTAPALVPSQTLCPAPHSRHSKPGWVARPS